MSKLFPRATSTSPWAADISIHTTKFLHRGVNVTATPQISWTTKPDNSQIARLWHSLFLRRMEESNGTCPSNFLILSLITTIAFPITHLLDLSINATKLLQRRVINLFLSTPCKSEHALGAYQSSVTNLEPAVSCECFLLHELMPLALP